MNRIQFVDKNQPATLQMQEFGSRTMQPVHMDETNPQPQGLPPTLARDYRPATIDQAAIPVRVEAWKLNGTVAYRVIGITWGGPKRTEQLQIRFMHGNAPKYEPVEFCQTKTSCPAYGIWCHHWKPTKCGAYWIEMRVGDRKIRSRKMGLHTSIGPDRYVTYYARLVSVPLT